MKEHFLCVCDDEISDEVLEILQRVNHHASKIGHITEEHAGKVIMESAFGGKRGKSFDWRTIA